MRSKKTLLLVAILIIVAAVGGYTAKKKFFDKKPKTPKTQITKPNLPPKRNLVESKPSGLFSETQKTDLFGLTPESISTETQPLTTTKASPFIKITLPPEKALAEGVRLTLEGVSVQSSTGKALNYFWELVAGPGEAIKIEPRNSLTPTLTMGELTQNTTFVLRLTVSDGVNESSADLKLQVFATKLEEKGALGGSIDAVAHLGENYLVGQGNELQLYDANFLKVASSLSDDFIKKIYGLHDTHQQFFAYVQSVQGKWEFVQLAANNVLIKQALEALPAEVYEFHSFYLLGKPYAYTLDPQGVKLWDLEDPKAPKLSKEMPSASTQAVHLSQYDRYLYLADETNIHLFDFNNSLLLASLSSGGSITHMETVELAVSGKPKVFLIVTVGTDRAGQGRQDYGVRLFAIEEAGKLRDEGRILLKDNPPVEAFHLIPGANKGLVVVRHQNQVSLRLVDLNTRTEIALQGIEGIGFTKLSDLETGKIKTEPVTVVADGGGLKVLSFAPKADGKTYQVAQKFMIPGLANASWVMGLNEKLLLVGDGVGGALNLVSVPDLKVVENLPVPFARQMFPAKKMTQQHFWGLLADVQPTGLKLWLFDADGDKAKVKTETLTWDNTGLNPTGFDTVQVAGKNYLAISAMPATSGGALVVKPWPAIATKVEKPIVKKGPQLTTKTPESVPSTIPMTMTYPLTEAYDVVLAPSGAYAYVATGAEGITCVDLLQGRPKSRVRLVLADFIAKGVWLSADGNLLVGAFLRPATQEILIKLYLVQDGYKMVEVGTVSGLPAYRVGAEWKVLPIAFTVDTNFLFVPIGVEGLAVYNISNPKNPSRVAQFKSGKEILGVAILGKYEKFVVAKGAQGITMVQFGF